MKGFRGEDKGAVGSIGDTPGGTPGKRTLTEAIQHWATGTHRKPATAEPAATAHTLLARAPAASVAELFGTHLACAPAQRRTATAGAAEAAPVASGSGSPLPAALQAQMDSAFDFDFGAVRVHQGAQADALGAVAYTQGTDLHFAPGRYDPNSRGGQELIGHELAHVVQQSEGRVSATTQFRGAALNDESGLEREADDWGARAARGQSVGRSAGGAPTGGGSIQRKVVQRSPQPTHSGRFLDAAYAETRTGVAIQLEFEPGAEVDATKIGLTQSVKTMSGGAPLVFDAQTAPRQVASGPGAGFELDRLAGHADPIYGAPLLDTGRGLADTPRTNAPGGATPDMPATGGATYQLGCHYTDAGGRHTQNAKLLDQPDALESKLTMEFETTALAIEGAQQGVYYGSVTWGWTRDRSGAITKLPFTLGSQGVPTRSFLAMADQWNSTTAGGTLKTSSEPTKVYRYSANSAIPALTVPRGTTVLPRGSFPIGTVVYMNVVIPDGTRERIEGLIRAIDLADQGDGPETVDLPIPSVETLSSAQRLNDGVPGPWRDFTYLPPGTRVTRTGQKQGHPPPGKVWVDVVDGPHTGVSGYVDGAVLAAERP